MTDINILNPIEIISGLFGNLYLFVALALLGYLYISAKYNLNFQLTVLGLFSVVLIGLMMITGLYSWIAFIIVGLGMFLAYVFWRWFATR